ncbi:hypothetical protein CTM67_19155 [Photobacterium phosphoreum]|nr:hypothetical protein CTM67_19155 [Photobacterium phosphoreum]
MPSSRKKRDATLIVYSYGGLFACRYLNWLGIVLIINYFRELLATLKNIDNKLTSIVKSIDRLAACVHEIRQGHILKTKESIEKY